MMESQTSSSLGSPSEKMHTMRFNRMSQNKDVVDWLTKKNMFLFFFDF